MKAHFLFTVVLAKLVGAVIYQDASFLPSITFDYVVIGGTYACYRVWLLPMMRLLF